MRKTLCIVAAVAAMSWLVPPVALASNKPVAHTAAVPPAIACTMGGQKVQHLAVCIVDHRMSRAASRCLIGFGITTAGVLIGGWIGGAASRAIAGGIIGGGGMSCVGAILNG